MIVVGALVGATPTGVHPVDGGIAIWRDGRVEFGLAEERASRRKYDWGFRSALRRGLAQLGIGYGDVDRYAFVSYGESHSGATGHIVAQAPELAPYADRIRVAARHHDAHAIGAAALAPWDDALVVVLDNEGLILGAQRDAIVEFNPMERASFYAASRTSLDLITRDLYRRDDVSLGEAYRRFTYYCGFPSHQFAGKTMALAGYGDPTAFGDIEVISVDRGGFRVDLDGGYRTPAESVVDFFRRHGVTVAGPRLPGGLIEKDHLNAAAFIQCQLEAAATARIATLLAETGLAAVCLAGGVAYNCTLVARLERELGIPVFVPPSPGDQGLGVGAALAAVESGEAARARLTPTAFLGGVVRASAGTVSETVAALGATLVAEGDRAAHADAVAVAIRSGAIVALVDGPSEFGRRALGARSLIALPDRNVLERLRELKHREWFRPFGASVLASSIPDTFHAPLPDPWMLRTSVVAEPAAFDGVVHIDGTVRAQAVDDADTSLLAMTLHALQRANQPPVVANTSFNLDGEPIVETEAEAIDLFLRHGEIDMLLLADSGMRLSRP